MCCKKIFALVLIVSALVATAPIANAQTISIDALQKQIVTLKQQIQQLFMMLSQLQTPICAKTLSGSPSNAEKEACSKAGGTINCGNGWCACSCPGSCKTEGETIDSSGSQECCAPLVPVSPCSDSSCVADSWVCAKKDGGNCAYGEFKGKCAITDVSENSGGSPTVKYSFTPNETPDMAGITWITADKLNPYAGETSAGYLGLACLKGEYDPTLSQTAACGIVKDALFDCALSVIKTGTCTPINIRFVDKYSLACAASGQNYSKVYTDKYPSECCQGLTEWASGMDTREIVNGLCKETGKLAGSPVGTCLNCGNGICESPENICNCQKDCGESGRYKCSSANDCYASCSYGCVNKTWVSKMTDCLRLPSYSCSCNDNKCVQSAACPDPRTSAAGESCATVAVYAKNPSSGQCCEYGNPCAAPEGWTTYYSKGECASSCNDGDKKQYTCGDGTKVTWCTCSNKKMACVNSPETLCPTACAAEGVKIYGKDLANGRLTACCKGLSGIGSCSDTGFCANDGSSVCAYCGNGECGLGENKANCPKDCEKTCKKEGKLFGYLEAECCEGLLKVYPEGAQTYKTGDSQNFPVTCKKK